MAKSVLTVKADQHLIDRVDALAEKTGESRSQVAERVLALGLDEVEGVVERFESGLVGTLLAMAVRNKPLMKTLADLEGNEWDEAEFQRRAENIARLRSKAKRKALGKVD